MPDHTCPILFVHIAKTAGTAVNSFIAQHYPAKRRYLHVENTDFRTNPSFAKEYDFLSGHVRATLLRHHLRARQFRVITMLREPFGQLASHLCWVRNIGANSDPKQLAKHPPEIQALAEQLVKVDFGSAQALTDFFESLEGLGLNLFDNCQTRYLLAPPNAQHRGQLDRVHLQGALAQMNRLDLVGVSEKSGEFCELLSHLAGFLAPSKPIRRENTLPQRFGLNLNRPAIRMAFADRIRYDLVLWSHATALFDRQWRAFKSGKVAPWPSLESNQA